MRVRLSRDIEWDSPANGPGLRAVLWFQGCLFNCPGCHNPETQDIDGGMTYDVDELVEEILEADYLDGVTFSGGDPLFQIDAVIYMAKKFKEAGFDVLVYSGSTYEKLIKGDKFKELTNYIDYLVDGPFVLSKLSLSLQYRGSSNQRIIDVQKTVKKDEVVEMEF